MFFLQSLLFMEKIMENKFKYSNDNKRYHTWNYHLQRKFGGKVFKVALNGGFTCPNIDGKKGVGGCIYCFVKRQR